ncbi:MAG: tyrosine--tRNA ligase [Rubrobacter sp.]
MSKNPLSAHPASGLFANAVDVVPQTALVNQLRSGKTLRIKLCMDPTAPDIHLGHSVILRKLREFQNLGHTAVLIIGDYTALVGDPSGRSKTRPVLTREETEANTKTYLDQAYLVLDPEKTEVRCNSEWLAPLDMADIIHLTRSTTVARILERDDFSKRFASNESISLTELLYPMMQAYDSVAVSSDVELGGTDQLYNLLMGRHVMEFYGKTPQCVLTMPLLVGTDGQKKMSKSLGNYIGLTDTPANVFGKVMSIPDDLMPNYYALLLVTTLPEGEPVYQKRNLGRRLVAALHGEEASQAAEQHFDTVTKRGVPGDVPGLAVEGGEVWIVDLITRAGFAKTNGEARRFVKGGAVRIDGEQLTDEKLTLSSDYLSGKVLQVGKRRYARLESPREVS